MRVGIICEGETDYPVLRAVVVHVCRDPALVVVPLCPDTDRLRSPATGPVAGGWQAVRAFLQTSADVLAIGTYDIVVVHVDADVLDKLSSPPASSPGDPAGGLDPLCRLVKGWASEGLPDHAVVVLPRAASESWLLAAHTNLKRVEDIDEPAEELARRGLLQRGKDGTARKRSVDFKKLAEGLPSLLADQRRLDELPELARFVGKLFGVQKAAKGARRAR